MKRMTVNQWCLLCAATALSASTLTGCVDEGTDAPPLTGVQGPTAEPSTTMPDGGMAGMGGMGGMGMGGSAGMGMVDDAGVGAGGASLDAGSTPDAS